MDSLISTPPSRQSPTSQIAKTQYPDDAQDRQASLPAPTLDSSSYDESIQGQLLTAGASKEKLLCSRMALCARNALPVHTYPLMCPPIGPHLWVIRPVREWS